MLFQLFLKLIPLCVFLSTTRSETVNFSSTQKWDQIKLKYASEPSYIFDDSELQSFRLPNYPQPNSEALKNDIKSLLNDKKLRTPERIRLIRLERKASMSFGPLEVSDFDNDHPIVEFTAFVMDSAGIPIFRLKKEFDRVRPSFIEAKIEPLITVPNHPAYPSGHATQNYLLAHAYSDLAQEYRDVFFKKAWEIARHREIAGVHYPSDSEAGRILAEQIFYALKKKPRYAELHRKALKSWTENKQKLIKDWHQNKAYELPLED